MPQTDLAFKRQLYQQLNPFPDQPIESDGPLYVPLYEGHQDPITQIEKKIVLSGADSMQFLSGCRGSGKTTELHRLRRLLEQKGYVVFHADALDYLNPAEPVEITELLVILAAAFSEQVLARLGQDPAYQSYLSRLGDYLTNTNVNFDGFTLKPGVAGFAAEFKATLRTTESFRLLIRNALAGRTKDLKAQADRFVLDAIGWLKTALPGTVGVVFLFDSLEQLRGSTTNEADVMTSVEKLFTQYGEQLALPEVHVVYTVPPWLRYRAPGAVRLERMLPCVKLWQYDIADHGRQACLHGWSVMRDLIRLRVREENMPRLFGAPDGDGNYPLLDKLIQYCGGHFRDLLSLVREAFVSADDLEIIERDVQTAVSSLSGQFPVAESRAEWLRKIHETNESCLPKDDPESVGSFTRFLDHHLVLLFANGKEWYDIHPIIHEEVFRISDRLRTERLREQAAVAAAGAGV